MKIRTAVVVLLCGCMAVMMAACSSSQQRSGNTASQGGPSVQVPCMIVLPVKTDLDSDEKDNYERAAELEGGAAYMDKVIAERLVGKDHVRVLSSRQVTSLIPDELDASGSLLEGIAQQLKCHFVMITTLSDYRQRLGGDYAVDRPASVSFQMKLYDTRDKKVVWSGRFAETQQSLFSNMMSLGKVMERGLRWVTAEELVEQGVDEKFGDCPYL